MGRTRGVTRSCNLTGWLVKAVKSGSVDEGWGHGTVQNMPMDRRKKSTRAAIAAVVIALWVPLGVWMVRQEPEVRQAQAIEEANAAATEPEFVWGREQLYLNSLELFRRPCPKCPYGALLGRAGEGIQWENEERVRILAVGDSFAYGAGLEDLGARWWVQVERILNERYGEGTFEVVGIGASSTSTFTHERWVKEIAEGNFDSFPNDKYGVLKKPFDALMFGYVANDAVFNEGDEFMGTSGHVPIPIENEMEVIAEPQKNPNWGSYLQSIKRIRETWPLTPLFLVPMMTQIDKNAIEPYEEAGFTIVPMVKSTEWFSNTTIEDRWVYRGDSHHNPRTYRVIAEDVADSISKNLPKDRIKRASSRGGRVIRPLIADWLDPTVRVSETDGTATVEWIGSVVEIAKWPVCRNAGGYGLEVYLECGKYFRDGKEIPTQILPCARLGRPYVALFFSDGVTGRHQVAYREGEAEKLDVYGYGYGLNWDIIMEYIQPLAQGETLTVDLGSYSGLLIAEDGKNTCEYEDVPGSAPSRFKATIAPVR